jgi:hypothetical protein
MPKTTTHAKRMSKMTTATLDDTPANAEAAAVLDAGPARPTEAQADPASAPEAAPEGAPEVAAEGGAAPHGAAEDLLGRLRQLERTAREAAQKRIADTERALEALRAEGHKRVERELDALLGKVGLVRKSRLEIVEEPKADDAPAAASATDSAQAA